VVERDRLPSGVEVSRSRFDANFGQYTCVFDLVKHLLTTKYSGLFAHDHKMLWFPFGVRRFIAALALSHSDLFSAGLRSFLRHFGVLAFWSVPARREFAPLSLAVCVSPYKQAARVRQFQPGNENARPRDGRRNLWPGYLLLWAVMRPHNQTSGAMDWRQGE
jgi:hypothetical protein